MVDVKTHDLEEDNIYSSYTMVLYGQDEYLLPHLSRRKLAAAAVLSTMIGFPGIEIDKMLPRMFQVKLVPIK
jgi:hypothetical protein